VEAHSKGSMGLAAAATGKGMNTVLKGLRRTCSDLAGEINWYKKNGKEYRQKIARDSRIKWEGKKGIVLKEGGRKEKILNFNRLLSIEISPEVKILKNSIFHQFK